MITILDYGSGNIEAISNIYRRINIEHRAVSTPEDLQSARKIILPGVGTFDECINQLNNSGLREVLDKKVIEEKVPTLGICVGMQLMANESSEGTSSGLGWIPGKVKKFDQSKLNNKPYLPHMGWNSVKAEFHHEILEGINLEMGFYFIHTYYYEPKFPENQLLVSKYGEDFTSAVYKENIFGMQFHPEKSHSNGIQLLNNFARL